MRLSNVAIIVISAMVIVIGCGGEGTSISDAKAPVSVPEDLDLSMPEDEQVNLKVKDPRIIVKVNGEPITMGEVITMANKVLHNKGISPYTPEGIEQLLVVKPNVFNTLVTLKLLKHGTKRLKMKLEPGVLDKQIEQIKSRYPSEEDFRKALENEGLTLEQYQKAIEEEVMVQTFKDMVMTEGLEKPSEKEIKAFYESHRDFFMKPEMVRVQSILIGFPENPTVEEKSQAFETINSLYFRAKEGEDFGELAKMYSTGPNAENGGDLGYRPREDIDKYLAGASDKYSLSVGSITPILDTPSGYVLLYPTDIKPAKNISLEQASPEIVNLLQEKEKAVNLQQWFDEENAKAEIEVVDPDLYLTVVTE